MTTAFVLSGGGSLGAVQVGMLQALAERDIHPDLLVGTSAGAVNAAYVAGAGTGRQAVTELAAVWSGLRRRDVFPVDPLRHVLAVAGARPSLCTSDALAALLAAHLPYRRLEEASVPVHVVATDLLSGQEVLLSDGDAVSAVLASTAIPGVFPAVERGGQILVDGGIADNAAISQAVALGADRLFVLPAGFACALDAPPASPLATALHALSLLIEQRLILEVAHFADRVEVNVLPPLCPLRVAPVDFSHAAELITRARHATDAWLGAGGPALSRPERFLSLHHHHRRVPDHLGLQGGSAAGGSSSSRT
jgi:NTE family protein